MSASRPAKYREWASPNLGCFAAGDELFLGELADRLQHREPSPLRCPVGDHKRLAHQRIQQIQRGEVVTTIGHRARRGEVEPASEAARHPPPQRCPWSVPY